MEEMQPVNMGTGDTQVVLILLKPELGFEESMKEC